MTILLRRSISSKSTIALSKKIKHNKLTSNNNNNNKSKIINMTSTTYIGKQFELESLKAFEKIGMSLLHIGGKSDGGIDLRGEWTFLENYFLTTQVKNNNNIDNNNNNNYNHKIPVIIQCKNVKNGCTPDHLRSLLGATIGWNYHDHSSSPSSSNKKVLGILVSSSSKPFTSDTLNLFNSSRLPLGLARVQHSIIQDFVLNYCAQNWLMIHIHPRYNSLGHPISPIIMTQDDQVIKTN